MKHKKYLDIQAAKPDNIGGFEVGDEIYIQTKVDGANAAIRYDSESDAVVAQSRKNILGFENTLRGFYEFTQHLDKELVKKVLGGNLILYAEWLVPHSVKYPAESYNKVYCYDVYDTEKECYLDQKDVQRIVKELNLEYIKVLYHGKFISWEHCKSFLPNSCYGEAQMEGVVCKNMTKLNDDNNRMPFYLKIVNDSFKETQHNNHKNKNNAEKQAEYLANQELTATIVTRPRVEKLLHKAVDENKIPENWNIQDMGTIARFIGKDVFEDCIKEEKDTVTQITDFGKHCNSITMRFVKEILSEKNKLGD